MKIIKLDENNPYTYQMYDFLDWFFDNGRAYLPWIFLRKGYLNGYVVRIPRWITKKEMDEIDEKVKDWINNINWE